MTRSLLVNSSVEVRRWSCTFSVYSTPTNGGKLTYGGGVGAYVTPTEWFGYIYRKNRENKLSANQKWATDVQPVDGDAHILFCTTSGSCTNSDTGEQPENNSLCSLCSMEQPCQGLHPGPSRAWKVSAHHFLIHSLILELIIHNSEHFTNTPVSTVLCW